jgi:phospholipase C
MGFLPGGSVPDISAIAVNPDSYKPCLANGPPDSNGNPTPTAHCDLQSTDPGAKATDAPAVQGFEAQLGFRLPNLVMSPFTRRHYVSHVPMDHTAIIKFVESRFIGSSAHLTNRDAAQPDLLDFFDFTNIPGRFRRPLPAFRFLPRWDRRAHRQACRCHSDGRV